MNQDGQARWRRAGEIFDAVADLEGDAREALLEAMCGGDATLRAEVERLLAADACTTDPFPGHSARWTDELAAAPATDGSEWHGRRIGAWRIVGTLGRGGMGVVHAVRRDDAAYAQRAALKLIRLDADSPAARERFLRERQTLARLQHPNIATLLDGGFTADGDPFFVMEHVDGQPIDAWCDARRLDLRARTELFGQVLDAVQYAHANLVVHRDLKPSNVLVDATGRAKLLDFGVAKQLRGTGDATVGPRALTLEYASPEQLHEAPITVATDIWQLGILLYRLLGGSHPFGIDSDTPLPRQLEHLQREALPLSRIAADPATAAARGHTPASLAKALRGDLSEIVRGCLQRAPEHRYPSVDALAADLAAWRAHRPLRVASPGRWRQAGLWLRRNRALAAATASVSVAILAGSAVALWQATEARHQQANAQQALQVVGDVLAAAAPENAMSHEVSVRDLLDRARAELARRDPAPDVRKPVQRMLGDLYQSLGDPATAVGLYAAGLADAEPRGRDEALQLADTWAEYSAALGSVEQGAESLRAAERSATLRRAHADAEPVQELLALLALGYGHYYADQDARAHELWMQAVTLADTLPDAPLVPVVEAWSMLGGVEAALGQPGRAVEFARRAIERADAGGLPADSPRRINLLRALAIAQLRNGDPPAAEASIREALALVDAVLDGKGDLASKVHLQLGTILRHQHRYREAIAAVERSIEVFPEDSEVGIAIALDRLASSHRDYGDYPRALELSRQAVARLDAAGVPSDDQSRRAIERNLAQCMVAARRSEEAAPLLQRLVESALRIDGRDSVEYMSLLRQQAQAALERQDPAAAESLLRELRPLLRARFAAGHPVHATQLQAEAELARLQGDLAASEQSQRRALALLRDQGNATLDIARAEAGLARILLARGDRRGARALLQAALPRLREAFLPGEAKRAMAEALALET